jgi:hypothetical protein
MLKRVVHTVTNGHQTAEICKRPTPLKSYSSFGAVQIVLLNDEVMSLYSINKVVFHNFRILSMWAVSPTHKLKNIIVCQ